VESLPAVAAVAAPPEFCRRRWVRWCSARRGDWSRGGGGVVLEGEEDLWAAFWLGWFSVWCGIRQ